MLKYQVNIAAKVVNMSIKVLKLAVKLVNMIYRLLFNKNGMNKLTIIGYKTSGNLVA